MDVLDEERWVPSLDMSLEKQEIYQNCAECSSEVGIFDFPITSSVSQYKPKKIQRQILGQSKSIIHYFAGLAEPSVCHDLPRFNWSRDRSLDLIIS